MGQKNVIGKLTTDEDNACEANNQVSVTKYTFFLFIKTFTDSLIYPYFNYVISKIDS